MGGPTILATFTVIAALLPMAFVTGLMGPYMSPIPINASMGMLLSLAIAFTVTPWLALKLLRDATPCARLARSTAKLEQLLPLALGPLHHGTAKPRATAAGSASGMAVAIVALRRARRA